MEDLITTITDWIQAQQVLNVIRAILIVVSGFVIARLVSSFLVRATPCGPGPGKPKGRIEAHRG
jgi:hypothetical protein